MAATLWHDDISGRIAVRFDYDPTIIEHLKTQIPRINRTWNPERRLWLIDPPYETTARKILGLNRNEPHPPTDIDKALVSMFDTLPGHLHEPTFKALLKVWHPDVGGDTRAAQALNSWRQRQAS